MASQARRFNTKPPTPAQSAMAPPPLPATPLPTAPHRKETDCSAAKNVARGPPTATQFMVRFEAKNMENPFRDQVPVLASPAAQKATVSSLESARAPVRFSMPAPPAQPRTQQRNAKGSRISKEEHVGCTPMKHTEYGLRDRTGDKEENQQPSKENPSINLFAALKEDVGVNSGGEVIPAVDSQRPKRKRKPTRKKKESMQNDEATVVKGTPLPSTPGGVQTCRQLRIAQQPRKADGNLGNSPSRLAIGSPRSPPQAAAEEDGGKHEGHQMGRRMGGGSALVITPGGTISKDIGRQEVIELRFSPSQELVIATNENDMLRDDAANDALAIEKRSSSPKNQLYDIEDNFCYAQDQEPAYDEWGNEEDSVHVEDAYESPNYRIHNHSPTKEDSGRQNRAPTPFPRSESREPERGRHSHPYSFAFHCDDHSTKRRRSASPENESGEDKSKRRRLSDTRHSLTLLSQAVHHLSLIQTQFLPIPLAKNDLGSMYARLQSDECLTNYGKAVLTRKMGEEKFWREAREYVSLEGERKREMRKSWWGLAFPQGRIEGWFVDGIVGGSPRSPEPEVVEDEHDDEDY